MPKNSGHKQSDLNSDEPLSVSELPPPPAALKNYEIEMSSTSLEFHYEPALAAGETPKLCLEHYGIGIYMGDSFQLEQQIDEVAKGRMHKEVYSKGSMTLIPMQHSYQARWEETIEALMFNLKAELLTRNAAELLGVEQVQFIPQVKLYDPLILQIALALHADLQSNKPGGRLYAEAMTHTLAVHLLRNYSSHSHKSIDDVGGLSPTKLKLVTDYINDYLDQSLGLEELATIAQLSPYHFSRSFKQSTGLTPHQYVIRQRVERAKILLKDKDIAILDVALICGFTHQSHLNRHFKRLTGTTPKKFAKS